MHRNALCGAAMFLLFGAGAFAQGRPVWTAGVVHDSAAELGPHRIITVRVGGAPARRPAGGGTAPAAGGRERSR